jgi:hypothetical protein
MAQLSPTQLEKPYHHRHEFYGLYGDRGERFLEKIKKGEPFELTDGSSVNIDKISPGVIFLESKEYKELGNGKKLFITELGELSLSQFKKTKEFGAGGGQGAGAKNTAIQESTQCVFNALIFNKKQEDLDIQDITWDNISSSYQYCNTTTTLKDIYEFSQKQTWQQSFLTSSNVLYSYISGSDFEHHRDSDLINGLYQSYNKTNVNFRSDKWNPSDIWFVKSHINNTLFSSSLNELNQQMEDLFLRNELIGISLKKLGKENKIEIKNLDKTKNKKYQYKGYHSTHKSKDVTLLYNEGKICFRTFNFASGWAGEILGTTASHGKIGVGAINQILKDLKLSQIFYPKLIKELFDSGEEIYNMWLEELLDKFIGINGSWDIFIQDSNIDWKVSKLIGLILIDIIETSPKHIQNKLITQIVCYASSELQDSSIYIKLS